MALTYTSSLVTARNKSKVDGYSVTVPSTVTTDSITVNEQARVSYNQIVSSYKTITAKFNALATEFEKARGYVVGDKLKSKLRKTANNCKNQGTYCTNRRKELENAFEFALLEAKVAALEEAIK